MGTQNYQNFGQLMTPDITNTGIVKVLKTRRKPERA